MLKSCLNSFFLTPGELYSYSYDSTGRLTWAVTPSGEWMRIDQDDACLSRTGVSGPRLCYLATINDQLVLDTSRMTHQEASSCQDDGQPRLSSDDELSLRMTEADCSFREVNFEDRSVMGLGLPDGLARLPRGQLVSLGDVTARFGLKSSSGGNLNGNAIFVSSLHLLKGVKMESVSGESLGNKTTTSFYNLILRILLRRTKRENSSGRFFYTFYSVSLCVLG